MKIDIEGHEKPVLEHFFEHAPRELWPRGIVLEHTHDASGVVEDLKTQQAYRVDALTARNVALRLP